MATTNGGETQPPSLAIKNTDKPTGLGKPEKPDEEQYRSDLAAAEKELDIANEQLNGIKAKLDLAKPANKDSPTAKRQAELRAELSAIRQQQQGKKSSRTSILDRIKKLDEQLKSQLSEQKTARERFRFKSVGEVDAEISRLQKQVDTGTMKLVDEKKALADISSLTKQKKGFAGLEESQKKINSIKDQIADLRKDLDDPESKALSDRYTEIGGELDKIKGEQDEAFKNLNSLRDQRTQFHSNQQEKYSNVRQIKDKYFASKRAFREYEQEAYRVRKERQKAERDAYEKGKRKQVAEQKLEEASAPAYQDEILTAQGLIRFFDPSADVGNKAATGPSEFAAAAQRKVDDSGMKGMRLVKKDDREDDYFVGGGGKKGKKGRKGVTGVTSPTSTEGSKFNLSIGIIEELAKIGVDPPSNQGDVPGVVEKLKEKLDHWKKDQDRKTKENIGKAQKEIEKLEAEANGSAGPSNDGTKDEAKKPAQKQQGVNGNASADAELAQEKDAAKDVAEEMQQASLEEDKEDVQGEA
ncbi:hypothetical protein EV356DRAFT_559825 [Viridothelium virens]|uniref:Nuclear segregation protein n=1 Tax=Viridothelium virens TaxID=1048519 RepID=A0A6A6H709_VIRVR|nr:hypothetical protein EV356DRAFT_559825 [Viridothelium virens]